MFVSSTYQFILSEHAQNQTDIAENLDRVSKSTNYQNPDISKYSPTCITSDIRQIVFLIRRI